jgi:Concanavalin A-like lectin/glucanases superfamily
LRVPPGRPPSARHSRLDRLDQEDAGAAAIAGALGNGAWGYILRTYDRNVGPDNQRLYLNGIRVAQMSDTQPLDLNSNPLGIGRHVSGIADPFNGHIDEFRIFHVQR